MASAASGMALSIRQAEESETFDLAGQTVETITNTIRSAFSEPLPLRDMIRVTFITGAGKQARQKYDEGAARAVTSTLRELGYEEDRAASAVADCAGSFKLQHDTGKNLKTVVVFPKIQAPANGEGGVDGNRAFQSLVPEGCPAHKIAMSTKNTFEKMLQSQCPSWSQKKGCAAALEHLKSMVEDMDAQLMKGEPLDDAQQDFYDHVTALDDKIAHVKEEMHKQVESGAITKFEKDALLHHNAERLDTLDTEMKDATGKKLEKLRAMKEKMTERKGLLENIDPKPPHKLRHEAEIAKLWKEALPLMKLEEQTKGRLLSVKETQSVARKDEIMEEIAALEEASRGWFEDDEAFEARVEAIRANFKSKLSNEKPKGGKKSGGGGGGGGGVATITGATTTTVRRDKWVTPGETSKKNPWGKDATKKKSKGQGSGVFAAMMMQDSGDSEDEDDDEESNSGNGHNQGAGKQVDNTSKAIAKAPPVAETNENQNSSSDKKKGGKKKKKAKGSNKNESDMTEEEMLNAAVATNREAEKKEKEAQQVSNPASNIFHNYLIPFVLGIVTWIASVFIGKSSTAKQKKN